MSADSQPLAAQGEKKIALPRFGLLSLFYTTAVIAGAIAMFGVMGIFWAAAVLGFWWWRIREINNQGTRPNSKGGFSIVELLVVIAIIGILFGMLMPAVSRPGYVSSRVMLMNSMRQVGLALHNYESANGHFPPAYIADEDGNPMHSWRVLILPYLEEKALFDQYDFNEPWDGPNNSKLVNKLQGNPFGANYWEPTDGLTGFKLVTGPETVFVKDQKAGFGAITDGSSNTICLVDDNSKRVNWMSPEDVTVDEAVQLYAKDNKKACGSRVDEDMFGKTTHYFCCVTMFDGSTQTLGLLDDPAKIRDLFTVADGYVMDIDKLDFEWPTVDRETKPEGYILVVVNLFLAYLPTFWLRKFPSSLRD